MGRVAIFGLFCGIAAMAGCIEPDLVQCSNGLVCPVGNRCDEVHQTCVSPDQLTVCEGLDEGSDCVAGAVSGGCFGGVCLARGCGNRVVETGEMCDDGNQISLDGCRSDCTSTEVCGNGFRDPGEPCDDGDLISRDGCDSRCQIEEVDWSVIPIAPMYIDAFVSAYDPAHGRLVAVAGGDTWEWDGAEWTVHQTSADPPVPPIILFYDPDRGEVNMVRRGEDRQSPFRTLVQLHAWREGQWVQVSHGDGPSLRSEFPSSWIGGAIYDSPRHRPMVVETSSEATAMIWVTDEAGAWNLLPDSPAMPFEGTMVFDPPSEQILFEASEQEWVYDGLQWSVYPTSFSGPSLAFDPDRGHTVLWNDGDKRLYERVGTEWIEIEGSEFGCGAGEWWNGSFHYNPDAAALDLFSGDVTQICRWDGSWTRTVPDYPTRFIGATYDPLSRGAVLLTNGYPDDVDAPLVMWESTGGRWERMGMPAPPPGRKDTIAIYSPGRRATVLYGGRAPYRCGFFDQPPCQTLTDAWAFDGATWTQLPSPAVHDPSALPQAAAYDSEHGRVIIATQTELWSLGDADDEWVELENAPSAVRLYGIAWDALNGNLVAAMIASDGVLPQLFDQREEGWDVIQVSPNGLSQPSAMPIVASDQRGGGVFAFDTHNGFVWERVGPDWLELPRPPVIAAVNLAAYDPVEGRLFLAGEAWAKGRYTLTLSRASSTELESCHPGEDIDGDGLIGCGDPDCTWSCTTEARCSTDEATGDCDVP
jgi:cysteine-rich repeat protein